MKTKIARKLNKLIEAAKHLQNEVLKHARSPKRKPSESRSRKSLLRLSRSASRRSPVGRCSTKRCSGAAANSSRSTGRVAWSGHQSPVASGSDHQSGPGRCLREVVYQLAEESRAENAAFFQAVQSVSDEIIDPIELQAEHVELAEEELAKVEDAEIRRYRMLLDESERVLTGAADRRKDRPGQHEAPSYLNVSGPNKSSGSSSFGIPDIESSDSQEAGF